jgi:streptogramin lyase
MKGCEMKLSVEVLSSLSPSAARRLQLSAACVAVGLLLTACGGGGDSGPSDVKGSVTGLTVDGLVLTNGTDEVAVSANAATFTVSPNGTLSVARQPLGFTQACEVSGTREAPVVTCGEAVAKVTSVAGQGSLQGGSTIYPQMLLPESNGDLLLATGNVLYRASVKGGLELIAGNPFNGGTVDGTGADVRFNFIADLAKDAQGNVYVIDSYTKVRKVTPAGVTTTVYEPPNGFFTKLVISASGAVYLGEPNGRIARTTLDWGTPEEVVPANNNNANLRAMTLKPDGTLYYATDDGLYKVVNQQPVWFAADSQATFPTNTVPPTLRIDNFNSVNGLAVDAQGEVFVSDLSGNVLRRINAAHTTATTIVGDDAQPSGNSTDGTGANASLSNLRTLALDATGTALVGVESNGNVRNIKDIASAAAQVTTPMRANPPNVQQAITDTGPAGFAKFQQPYGVAVAADGVTYVSEPNTQVVRKIAADGTVSSLFSFPLNQPESLAVDTAGNVYVADQCVIRKVTKAGVASILAGVENQCGTADGAANGSARLLEVTGLAVDVNDNVFFTQRSDGAVRKVSAAGVVSTVTSNQFQGNQINSPTGIAVDATGTLYVTDFFQHMVFKVTQGAEVTVTALAGQAGVQGISNSAEGDALIDASFDYPTGIAVDKAGNVYVAQQGNGSSNAAVRQITPAGAVRTLAGGSTYGYQAGLGGDTTFSYLGGMAMTSSGALLVVDRVAGRLSKVESVKRATKTVAIP